MGPDSRLDRVDGNAQPGRELRGEEARVGLCVRCRFGRAQPSPRTGHRFWRCGRSDTEPEFPRYPRLPLIECSGFTKPESEEDPI
jgi:hypothetical protein